MNNKKRRFIHSFLTSKRVELPNYDRNPPVNLDFLFIVGLKEHTWVYDAVRYAFKRNVYEKTTAVDGVQEVQGISSSNT